MPKNAKVYICLVGASGVLATAAVFQTTAWPTDSLRFITYFLLSCFAATLKLRLPGMEGTMSIGFVIVLLAISQLTEPEAMAIACSGIVIQCFWKAKRRPTAVQVAFNVAATAVSVSLTYQSLHLMRSKLQTESIVMLIAVITCCYFASSSALVTGVLSLVQAKRFLTVWAQSYRLSLPYYLLGGAVAGFVALSSQKVGWQLSLAILPVMGLVFSFYQVYLARMERLVSVHNECA